MYRLLPPTGFSLWFGECSPLSVSSECERERMAYFFPLQGRRADNQVSEKESHLEQRRVYPFTSVISCRCPSLSGSTYQLQARVLHVNTI